MTGADKTPRSPAEPLLIAAAAVAAFAPALRLPFVYDDFPLIRDNAALASPAALAQLAGPGYYGVFGVGNYHPLPLMAWALLRALAGPSPWVFHALSLALHALNAVLVLRLTRRLGHPLPLAAAALWTLTPLHCQALYVGAFLPDLACAFFCLLWLLRLLERDPLADVPGYLLLGAALLCKETAAAAPLALLALRAGRQPGRLAWRLRGGLYLLAGYALFRLAAINDLEMLASSAGGTAEPWSWPLLRAATALQLSIWPNPLTLMRSAPGPAYLFGLRFLLPLAALAAAARAAEPAQARRGLLWAGAWLLPFLNLVPLSYARGYFAGRFLNERYLYLSALGAAWVLTAAAHAPIARPTPAPARRRAAAALALALAAGAAAESWRQARRYGDPVRLWAHAAETSPRELWALNTYGVALLGAGRPQEARAQFLAALALRRRSAFELGATWANLGAAQFELGQREASARSYRAARTVDPGNAEARRHVFKLSRIAP